MGKKGKVLVKEHVNDPWTWTIGWGLTVGGVVWGRGEQQGKNWDNCNRTTMEFFKKERNLKVQL